MVIPHIFGEKQLSVQNLSNSKIVYRDYSVRFSRKVRAYALLEPRSAFVYICLVYVYIVSPSLDFLLKNSIL